MIIRSATFTGSFVLEENCPSEGFPEFAFIGRSNVGKSSLINMLCSKKDLVKISKTPGKTQTLNFFLINQQWYFVDLPGYGYAKVSRALRKKWEVMIQEYLTGRKPLLCVFVLIDARLKPQSPDLEFVNRLGEWQIPFALVFTKSDKAGKLETMQHLRLFHEAMKERWEKLPETFITSAEKKTGREELLYFMEHVAATNK